MDSMLTFRPGDFLQKTELEYLACIMRIFGLSSLSFLNVSISQSTPGSMNSLFSDFFREFWRGILGVVRNHLGEVLGGF